ncbi:MAG: alpha/beta hydrolase [Thermoleophilia bacterium]|nr:alpha/beta hydrolase [Thermoleophilia bacterium]
MAKVPPEKPLSREQILRKVRLFRFMASVFGRRMMGAGKTFGKEMFLDTKAGKVRVLAYNLEKAGRLPLYINIHGGGFVLGHPEMEDRFMPVIAQKAGVRILSVDYSLAPEAMFPVALNECYAVVEYAKTHAAELGTDPGNVAIGGQSAGGNLSAGVCLLDAERRELGLKALVLDYPPLDIHTDPYLKPRPKKALSPRMSRVYDQAYAGTREAAKNPLISPCYATPDQVRSFPPTLVITAGQDSLAPEAEAFKDKLIEAGVAVTFRRFEGARHGFNLMDEPGAAESWQMIVDHLNRYLEHRG